MLARSQAIALASLLGGLWAGCANAASPVPENGIIAVAGQYALTGNRSAPAGAVIQINAADVDLDLGGWFVRCTPPNPATALTYGVVSAFDHVTIRNGSVAGCFIGIAAVGPSLTVANVDLSGNTYIGLNAGGGSAKISGCVFQSIAGYSLEAYAVGINSPGSNSVIERNTFRQIYRQPGAAPALVGEGVGILVAAGQTGVVIRSNWMENGSPSDSIGIWLAGGSAAYVAENTITNFGDGAIRGAPIGGNVLNNRLLMRPALPGSWAVGVGRAAPVQRNVIVGFETPLLGSPDAGENLIIP